VAVSYRVKLLASHAAVALAVSAVALLVVERAVSSRMEAEIDRRLEAQAHELAPWLNKAGHPDALASRLAGVVGARVTIIDAGGAIVGDSAPDTDPAEARPGELPEVQAVRDGSIGHATRRTASGERVRYVAVPAPEGAVVRLGLPTEDVERTRLALRRQLALASVASLLVAFLLAALVVGPLTRRLRDATVAAQRLGAGDYRIEAPADARDEVGVLAGTLAKAAAELRETDARRREFLATVAHEIRTPITSIQGFAQTLADPGVSAEDREEFLRTIHRNAVRVGQLVERLLELEALQAGAGPSLEIQRIELAPVAQHVAATLRERARAHEAALAIEVAPELTVRADPDALERILLNLADNGLRHGGPGVQVTVGARVHGDRCIVTVADTGPGIPDADRPRIFERFHRAASKDRSGSGLGLAIARELAIAMGGDLRLVNDDTNAGATFVLDLPA